MLQSIRPETPELVKIQAKRLYFRLARRSQERFRRVLQVHYSSHLQNSGWEGAEQEMKELFG